MFHKIIILIALFLLALSFNVQGQMHFYSSQTDKKSNFHTLSNNLDSNADSLFDSRKGSKPLRRWQNFWKSRIDSNGFIPNSFDILNEYNQLLLTKNKPLPLSNGKWIEVGPREPQSGINKLVSGSGRINCIAFHPSKPEEIWAGSASGGLWKSQDKGSSWEVIPFTEFLSMGVSDIAIAKSNPNVFYVATGDADGGTFLGCYSLGLIKSTDAGNNWQVLDLGLKYSDAGFISKVIIHPYNHNIIYIATSNGILSSNNGGNNWLELLSGENIRDLMFKPDNPNVIYATTYTLFDGASILISEDAGNSWFIHKYFPDANRIKIAVSTDKPDYILALASDKVRNSFHSLHLSRSAGIVWEELLQDTTDFDFLVQAQGFFNLVLEFNPLNSKEFFIGGVWLYKGHLDSNTFSVAPAMLHVDFHDVKFNPHDSLFYVANDGGVYRFDQRFNNAVNLSNNLGITQFYRIGLHPVNEHIIYGGSQDNNVFEWFYDEWKFFWGGDGMECFVDPRDPSLIYFSTQRGKLYNTKFGLFNIQTNEQRPWVTEFMLHPMNYDHIFFGYENLWMSDNQGETFKRISDFDDRTTITAIALSYNDPMLIYTANSENLYKSTNAGDSWVKILQTKAYISDLQTDKQNNLWVAFGRFTPNQKVFFLRDSIFDNHTFNLPNIPVNCIAIDSITGRIYIGTDLGVFDKMPGDTSWSITGTNLPAVIINELEIHYGTGNIFAASFGRGIWSFNLYECFAEKPIIISPSKYYFCYGDSLNLSISNPQVGYQYIWNDGEKGSTRFVSKSGTYYVSAISPENCIAASDSIYIWKPYEPFISMILMSANPICSGDTAIVRASYNMSQAAQYVGWSNGVQGLTGKFSQSGDYYFILIDEFGCIKLSEPISIYVNQRPDRPLIKKDGNWLIASDSYTYTWFRNGEKLEDFTGNSCYIFLPGTYQVMIRDQNFCTNYSEEFIVAFPNDSNSSLQYKLFPNPNTGIFSLEIFQNIESNLMISIYNSLGQIIDYIELKNHFGYHYQNFDLRNYAQSNYYIILQNNTEKRKHFINIVK